MRASKLDISPPQSFSMSICGSNERNNPYKNGHHTEREEQGAATMPTDVARPHERCACGWLIVACMYVGGGVVYMYVYMRE
jgi:hypothetical protein